MTTIGFSLKFIIVSTIAIVFLSYYLQTNLVTELLTKFGLSFLVFGSSKINEGLISIEQLRQYDGTKNSLGLRLAILGQVFDVSKGHKHYGPGGSYEFFSAKDASKAYVTGKFEEDLTDDISDLSPQEILAIEEWRSFYKKEYTYVGKLIGRFYNENGDETISLKNVKDKIQMALDEKENSKRDDELYPPCNSEWTQKDGGYVWCSENSGGIQREWAGVPRRYFKHGKTDSRCACIRTFGPPTDNPKSDKNTGDLENKNFREYKNCDKLSPRCKIS